MRLDEKMSEFQLVINYKFNDIENLKKAMCTIRVKPQNRSKKCLEYTNSGLATIGDALLSSVLADHFYSNGLTTKGDITTTKSSLENNRTLHNVVMSEKWIYYAYNENGFFGDENIKEHMRVQSTKHDSYVEAIIGAIYYDSNYENTKKWIVDFLLPLLGKYKCVG